MQLDASDWQCSTSYHRGTTFGLWDFFQEFDARSWEIVSVTLKMEEATTTFRLLSRSALDYKFDQ
jgi:hypothetical protein